MEVWSTDKTFVMEALFVVPDVPEYEATEPRVSKEGPDGVL